MRRRPRRRRRLPAWWREAREFGGTIIDVTILAVLVMLVFTVLR